MIRRIVGWAIIAVALWMFFPIPGPDDIINIILGGFISDTLGIELWVAIALTYTVIPFFLLYLGCMILPGNTQQKFNYLLGKVRNVVMRIVRDPRLLMISIIVFVIMYFVYVSYISGLLSDIYTNVWLMGNLRVKRGSDTPPKRGFIPIGEVKITHNFNKQVSILVLVILQNEGWNVKLFEIGVWQSYFSVANGL